MTNILQEADSLVNGDRLDTYEGTDDTIVALWSAYLGIQLTVLDYASLMVLLKIARTKGKFHRDSWVDIAGYAEVGPRLWLAKQEPEKLGALTPEKTGKPRVWESLTAVPEDLYVFDSVGDLWLGEGEDGTTVYDEYGPFTEVLVSDSDD